MRAMICAFFLLAACGCHKQEQPTRPPPLVSVAKIETKTVPRYIETVGHIEPIRSVDVQAQVTGVIEKQHFERGSFVRAGDLLFTIDQRPYLAELEKADAILSQNLASLKYAQDTTERNTPLVKDEFVSQNRYEGYVTETLVDEGKVQETIAEITLAQVNLGYCTITAPFDGKTGDIRVTEGNTVYGNDTKTLVTLNQITPIYANYYIPERYLEEVKRYLSQGDLATHVWFEGGTSAPIVGRLFFIDNEVNRSTGMILLKSIFPNELQELWPDQYVRVQLVLEMVENAVLVPAEAVQLSTKGKFVYVIDGDTATQRYIELGQKQGDDYVAQKGLAAGESVVLEGQISLYSGAKVRVKS